MIEGNAETFLEEPGSIVLTKTLAEKLFGNSNPVNRIIELNNTSDFKVTGIIEDSPVNSHIEFDALVSFSTLKRENRDEDYSNNWGNIRFHTYVLLQQGTSTESVGNKLEGYIKKYVPEATMEVYLQPFKKIHLYSALRSELGSPGSVRVIYIFSAIAFIIILIACFNYINLTTAKSSVRAREIGIRKIIGAAKRQLKIQFILESVIYSFISFIVSILLLVLLVPHIDFIDYRSFHNFISENWRLGILFLLVSLMAGVLGGAYPAFVMSGFKPVNIIKGKLIKNIGKEKVRDFLVLFQYTVSIVLIIGTITAYKQIHYIKNKDLGFNKDMILVIPLQDRSVKERYKIYKPGLKSISSIRNLSASLSIPGERIPAMGFIPEGYDKDEREMISFNYVDYDFFETMGIKVLHGRTFSKNFPTDSSAVVVNKELVEKLNWDFPLDKYIIIPYQDGEVKLKVIGVIDNFHHKSVHNKIEPMLFMLGQENSYNYMVVELTGGFNSSVRRMMEEKWSENEKTYPFSYFLLRQSLNRLYENEEQQSKAYNAFSIIAILISCLGLLGLVIITFEKRRKEISIRKVMGASTNIVFFHLLRRFISLVLSSMLIGFPIAYLLMANWLRNFSYRTQFSWWVFFAAGFLLLLITFSVVIIRTLNESRMNPVYALREQ